YPATDQLVLSRLGWGLTAEGDRTHEGARTTAVDPARRAQTDRATAAPARNCGSGVGRMANAGAQHSLAGSCLPGGVPLRMLCFPIDYATFPAAFVSICHSTRARAAEFSTTCWTSNRWASNSGANGVSFAQAVICSFNSRAFCVQSVPV